MGVLLSFFVPVHWSTLSFPCIYSILRHTPPTASILFFTYFYISLCEVLLIYTPCLLLDYTSLILFLCLFVFMNFSFLIMILIVSISYFDHSHRKWKDSLETRAELAVLRNYVENLAMLEPILLYRASKCKQTKEQGSKEYLWTYVFTFL